MRRPAAGGFQHLGRLLEGVGELQHAEVAAVAAHDLNPNR